MGAVTHQYSAGEIVEKYRKHIANYNNIIVDLKNMMGTTFIKRQNIGIFLNYHLRFCVEAVEVLGDAIEAIQNSTVDESICIRLEGLFESCKHEHRKLEDTYNRVPYEQSKDFYSYENLHSRMREECDEMEYCGATVKFVKTMIVSSSNINVFNGDVRDVLIQQGTVNSKQTKSEKVRNYDGQVICPQIENEKTSFKMIFKRKFIELIIGVFFILVSEFIKKYMGFAEDNDMHIWCIITYFLSIIVAITFIMSFCWDLVCMTKLSKKGSFVEFMSKKYCIYIILNIFKKDLDKDSIYRQVGKCFKNVDGEIYQIKSIVCPYCKSEPIGKMELIKNLKANKYIWRCLENSSHEVEFDYKQKLL